MPTNPHEKAMQRALIQYRNPKNYDLVVEALKLAGRTDLIGFDKKCLIRPKTGGPRGNMDGKNGKYNGNMRKAEASSQEGQKNRKKKTIRNVHKKAAK